MSLSKAERHENIQDTLRIALSYLGDNAISGKWLDASDPVFGNVLPTTWKHLADTRHAVEHRTSTSLCAAFKDTLKDRQNQAYPILRGFAEHTGIPEQFIFNVVESRIIEYCFKQHGVAWQTPGAVIRIPIDVGLDLP